MSHSEEKVRILVVDDIPQTLEVIRRNLTSKGYAVYTSQSVEDAIKILESTAIDLVITDWKMPKVCGFDLIRHVRENFKDTEVMMITGYATVPGAVQAIKMGAEEYLAKPFTDDELFTTVRQVLDKFKIKKARNEGNSKDVLRTSGLIGESKAMIKVYDAIKKAASSKAIVLITGESGTGKELVARAIHYNSQQISAPFIPINCGGIPEGLLESELFGYVKGAFTGATETRAGFFQTAEGGTIFLDEISETSLSMQVKLLRVIQDKEVRMVGAAKTRKVDVRILAATNKDLLSLVKKDTFREDLYFRLNVITIHIPPLRERNGDILLLAHYFVDKFSKEYEKTVTKFSDKALEVLNHYHWPGNVRELENIIERLVVMTDGDEIDVPDLPPLMRFSAPREAGFTRTLAEVDKDYIRNILEHVNGNKTKAAKILGIDRKTLREKLKPS